MRDPDNMLLFFMFGLVALLDSVVRMLYFR